MIKNKKGDTTSLIISLIVIIFVLALASLLFSKVFISVVDELKNVAEFSNTTKSTMTTVSSKTIPFLDYLILFSFIAIVLGLIISSIYIDTHPAVVIVFIVLLIVAIVLGGIFANVFTEIGEESELSSTYNQFTYTKIIMSHLPLWLLATGAIVGIIFYSKRGGGYVGA